MADAKKSSGGKRTKTGATAEKERQVRKGAEAPRDLATEDRGVPRGDWNDEPLQEDDGGEGIRSNFDDHYDKKKKK